MSLSLNELHKHLSGLKGAKLDYPFGEQPAVYKFEDKMFALMDEKAEPLRISLKCDPMLSDVLRKKYESVMPGYHLNKKHWNTLVLSGQLEDTEVIDLINHSYQLVGGGL